MKNDVAEFAARGVSSGTVSGPSRRRSLRSRAGLPVAFALFAISVPGFAAPRDDALAALKKAATFYRTQIASHGGYVYYYSEDLQQRWGEGAANRDQIFVQPPGTPAVGLAYLRAYSATGDAFYLDAARETAHALIDGQLQSGGWRQTIDFDPKGSTVGLYRNGRGQGRNHTLLDDNQTQAAILFLTHRQQRVQSKRRAVERLPRSNGEK